jgi:surface antigen
MRGPLKSHENPRRNFGPILSAAALGATLILAACAMPPATSPASSNSASGTVRYSQPDTAMEEEAAYISCVPYARTTSGVQLFGDAWTWWKAADGKYAKGAQPTKGAVLTLQKTKSLPMGHVAVVAQVSTDPRKIMVDHANWGDNGTTRGKVHHRQPVVDVSKNNDWSEVRFMNTVGTFGRVYPAHGFIYAEQPNTVPKLDPQIPAPPPSKPLPPTRTAQANGSKS